MNSLLNIKFALMIMITYEVFSWILNSRQTYRMIVVKLPHSSTSISLRLRCSQLYVTWFSENITIFREIAMIPNLHINVGIKFHLKFMNYCKLFNLLKYACFSMSLLGCHIKKNNKFNKSTKEALNLSTIQHLILLNAMNRLLWRIEMILLIGILFDNNLFYNSNILNQY